MSRRRSREGTTSGAGASSGLPGGNVFESSPAVVQSRPAISAEAPQAIAQQEVSVVAGFFLFFLFSGHASLLEFTALRGFVLLVALRGLHTQRQL